MTKRNLSALLAERIYRLPRSLPDHALDDWDDCLTDKLSATDELDRKL